MKVRNLFLISSLVFLGYACQDDQETRPTPTPGEDVQFGGTVNGENLTRTIYGDKANNSFPIYWLQGDQVIVASPQCAITHGTYQVPDEADHKDYAGEFTKIGDAGVQWGTTETANFYSIYPANANIHVSGTTFSGLHVSETQYNTLAAIIGTATEESPAVAMPADMKECFMYARTENVYNGAVVNLGYSPLSTAIRIKVKGPANNTEEKVQIQSIRLTAPAGVKLSGDFSVSLDGATPVVNAASNASNSVEVRAYDPATQGYITLGQDQVAELNLFVIPQSGTKITNEWKITVTTPTQTFTKSLGGSLSGEQGTLQMGKVHYLPTLPALDVNSEEWDSANWMVNIPRNVYLSEISIPGSWNSLNKDFQGSTDIATQYSNGVRAFHLDTRYNATRTGFITYTYTLTDLAIANGGTAWDANNTGNVNETGKVMNDSPTFAKSLESITNHVKADEYMVVFVTFAQNSATKTGETWEQAVSNICAINDKVIMATEINSNTVVGDVLGSVIVIVNTESIPAIDGSKCFFANVPLKLTSDMFGNGVYGKNPLYYTSTAQSDITLNSSQCQVEYKSHFGYNGQGDAGSARGWLPTPAQRLQQVNDVLAWSQTNYQNLTEYAHNNWIYLGIGGYQGAYGSITGNDVSASDGSYESIALTYNNWIDGKVKAMDAGETNYYPVGIVLMNKVTNYSSVLKDILLLNNKYRKAYDPNWEPKPSTGQSDVQSSAPDHSSGVVDNNENAVTPN